MKLHRQKSFGTNDYTGKNMIKNPCFVYNPLEAIFEAIRHLQPILRAISYSTYDVFNDGATLYTKHNIVQYPSSQFFLAFTLVFTDYLKTNPPPNFQPVRPYPHSWCGEMLPI